MLVHTLFCIFLCLISWKLLLRPFSLRASQDVLNYVVFQCFDCERSYTRNGSCAIHCFLLCFVFVYYLSLQLNCLVNSLFFFIEKARARWAKLKRFVKSGAYLDDWNAPVSLVTVANTIQRMNHKEKTMIEKGVSVYINTSRSGPPDTARSKLSRTSGSSETSETKIIDRFQKELSKRDLAMSSKSMALKPLNQITPNLAGMVLGWVPFKTVSDSPALNSRWLLLLKIEISSIVHCSFSINQNELKF